MTLQRKTKPFFYYKNKTLQSLKNRIFPKGLTNAFSQKIPNLSLFAFAQKKTRNNTE